MIEFVEYRKIAFRGSVLQLGALKEEVIGAKSRIDPEEWQKQRVDPRKFTQFVTCQQVVAQTEIRLSGH